jgi:hypothetical protein
MGKKKRGHPDVEELLSRPWCYYCPSAAITLSTTWKLTQSQANETLKISSSSSPIKRRSISSVTDAASD